MPALDIFSGSAFSMVALTDAINQMPFVPGRIASSVCSASRASLPPRS